MAPFLPGDYITFSGIKDGNQIIAYSIVSDSVQITTTGVPAYIRVEDAIIGTFDNQDPANVAPADSRVSAKLIQLPSYMINRLHSYSLLDIPQTRALVSLSTAWKLTLALAKPRMCR